MIDLIPGRQADVQTDKDQLDESVGNSITTYEQICIPSPLYPAVPPVCVSSGLNGAWGWYCSDIHDPLFVLLVSTQRHVLAFIYEYYLSFLTFIVHTFSGFAFGPLLSTILKY